ncbi:cyclase-like protein 2 [Apium graveolens]|uniref:cyclase-like protein 2 n=1 Tax=Apium graveolens TaxID=4045 RepID=UPI003D7AEF98
MSKCDCPCTSSTCPDTGAATSTPNKQTSNHKIFSNTELRVIIFVALIFTAFCFVKVINLQKTSETSIFDTDEMVTLRSEAYMRREVYIGRIHDISHKVQPNMPSWGSQHGFGKVVSLSKSMKNGSLANNSEMKLDSTHTGTHVDAPGHVFHHYFDAGLDVDTLDLDTLNGPALLVDVPRHTNITAEAMMSLNIPKRIKRVLFRTLNTARYFPTFDMHLMWKKEFDTSYVGFTRDGAQWLVDNTDIKLVGVDYLSAAAYDDLIPSHHVFLQGRDIILVEGQNLDNIDVGVYTVHCLPLRLIGAEGSPVRCILIKIEADSLHANTLIQPPGEGNEELQMHDVVYEEDLYDDYNRVCSSPSI